MTREEMETVISYDEAAGTATVYTHSPILWRTLKKLAAQRPGEAQFVSRNAEGGATYVVPKSWIQLAPPRRLTEEQRQAKRERIAQARQRKVTS